MAQDITFSVEYKDCIFQSKGITEKMDSCILDELDHQDTLLNDSYKTVMSNVDEKWKEEFRKAQRLWIQYRDANCKLYGMKFEGGTATILLVNDCVLQMTARRALELRELIGIEW
jgi:uncharacterized protein YecT (DUF1311 family)